MGIRRHHNIAALLGQRDIRPAQVPQFLPDLQRAFAHPERQVQGNLIIAAAGGVELAAWLADAVGQRFFDDHVNVFEAFIEDKVAGLDVAAYPLKPRDNCVALRCRDQARGFEHGRVGDRPGDVMLIEPTVVGDGFDEGLGECIGRLADPRLPGFEFSHKRGIVERHAGKEMLRNEF